MPRLQRYVSDELTHFVGRGLPSAEDQYALLVHVLTTGSLTPPPHDPDFAGDLLVDGSERATTNRVFDPRAVCFCDIPVGDLDIHVQKYSAFGIAFRKPLVVDAGASPVFYVASASATHASDGGGWLRETTRGARFDHMIDEYLRVRGQTEARLATKPEHADLLERWLRVSHFLDFEVFAFLKMFEYPTRDEAPENYYMEREWRLVGALRFGLEDVRRVILPESFAARLRRDVPGYHGQVTYAEIMG